MGATTRRITSPTPELDENEPGIGASTLDRLHAVQALINQGETDVNIARFIASQEEFTDAERVIARLVLRRHSLARHAV
jgi:hypothetical protein